MHRPGRPLPCRPVALAILAAAVLAAMAVPASAQERDCVAGLSATTGADGSIALAWPAATDPEVTGHQVLVRPVGGSWAPIDGQLPATATSWTDTGTAPEASYEYAVVVLLGEAQGPTYCPVVQTAGARALSTPDRAAAFASPAALGLVAAVAVVAAVSVVLVRRK